MNGNCVPGENLRQEYLASLGELVAALKTYGRFAHKTRLTSQQSVRARIEWERHWHFCIVCYRKWKVHRTA